MVLQVDANRALGLPDDCREYSAVHNILDHLRVKSVALLTNNPRKIDLLQSLGTSNIPESILGYGSLADRCCWLFPCRH